MIYVFMLNRLLALSLFFFSFNAIAIELQIQTNSGTDIPVTIFKPKETKSVLLWIPTEYGIHGREDATAKVLAEKGIEVWLADLHSAYFLPVGRRSYNDVDLNDITDLIINASQNKKYEVTLFATGRAAPLALNAARKLQGRNETRSIVKSAVLFHPNFYANTTKVGKNIEYLPITYATNLALYIAQPALSGKSYRLNELEKHLQTGGSDVITQILPGVADGFHVRKPDNKTEEKFYFKTPAIIHSAIRLLNLYKKPRTVAQLTKTNIKTSVASMNAGLQIYQGKIDKPYLDFKDLDNFNHSLKNHRDEVLLLNFWATWCPPCVKELPSLNRLQRNINSDNFNILAINIGEETETVKKFLKPMNIEFPVLTDPQGLSVKPWKLVAFPSSFVIDKQGKIRYGLFGGIEWDNPEVLNIIQSLLNEN